jgi:hypothetical protein
MKNLTPKRFPHTFCLGWVPQAAGSNYPIYTRDPVTHTVSRYQMDSERRIIKTVTDFVNLGGLNYEGKIFKRRTGMGEYYDKTNIYKTRHNLGYEEAMASDNSVFRRRSSPMTQFAHDSIEHHENNPFRVGRYSVYFFQLYFKTV